MERREILRKRETIAHLSGRTAAAPSALRAVEPHLSHIHRRFGEGSSQWPCIAGEEGVPVLRKREASRSTGRQARPTVPKSSKARRLCL
ncbi:hypothetical protein C2845_PM01G18200 [Panicum miliaceum]|uniref:Uncharacterized protein n=1 Tax=Panicum miliaceum TaxID=4540 RepID=A0A3L6TR94_PANMI|nr:hypothetical protein C2845_PM01G18200 [Panicum miliaceum]